MGDQIVWFRNDLRLRDNAALSEAIREAARNDSRVHCVYILDDFVFGKTAFGFERCGRHRRRFLAESLADLDRALRERGSVLLLQQGDAAAVLSRLASETSASNVWFQKSFATEEKRLERRVRKRLEAQGITARMTDPGTMLSVDSLPFPVDQLPDVFSRFRRAVEKGGLDVPSPLPAPKLPAAMPSPDEAEPLWAMLRQWQEEGVDEPRGFARLKGGEAAAWQRLEDYFWQKDRLREYKETRNGMLGLDYSSKLSPWLAMGCVSARDVYAEVARYEAVRIRNQSTYWLVFELLWRDYFQFILAKHGRKLFQPGGLRQQRLPWSHDEQLFGRWRSGTTGFPLIDASMRELEATGFMSNRGRQNVASFLTKNLGVDWRLGAEWFESLLIDYDPASNYGNWNYTAGVGNDARGFRWFNTLKQAEQYDRGGSYVRHWLPCLANVPGKFVHTPWKMHAAEQDRCNCRVGADYPSPVVDLYQSAQRNEQAYWDAVGQGA